jgi:hypothetical protein
MGTVRFQVVEQDGQRTVKEIHKIVVHRFDLSDVEDPDLYAAEPIWKWQQTDAGKFVMEHAVDQPEWHRHPDPMFMGYRYIIIAELESKKLAEYYLKWGDYASLTK